jgi:acyl-CoA dehydrogenase
MLADYAGYDAAIGLDWYALDPNLSRLFDRLLPDRGDRAFAEEQLGRFGKLVGQTIAARAEITDKHGPVLQRYDRWGRDEPRVVHHPTWVANKDDLVRAGFVGMAEHAGRKVPSVVTAGIAYVVCQAETAVYCALGMAGGAADIVERYAPASVRDDIVGRLMSLDPEQFWNGGMFLTERQGGSDVGANSTRAVRDGDEWRLYGDKHFCSNVDADVFIVLARPEGARDGTAGLATFIVPSHLADGSSNGFRIKRLKPKLGTIAVPTGEVTLDGAVAWLAGQRADTVGDGGATSVSHTATSDGARDGRGIRAMMEMVNGSRFGVALMGLGIHRRSWLEAAIYAAGREQFGHRIDSYPLVRETLVDLLVDLEAGMALTFECAAAARLAPNPEEGALLRRIAIPLAKLRTCRVGLESAMQALEVFGGNGYMEDWPLARQLRDAQCHTIWEGTENICALDVHRAMRSDRAHEAVLRRIDRALEAAEGVEDKGTLDRPAGTVRGARAELVQAISYLSSAPEDLALLQLRRFAYLMADTLEAALLCEEAAWSLQRGGDARKAAVAALFCRRRLEYQPVRGITSNDRTVLELFAPLIRYGELEPEQVLAASS